MCFICDGSANIVNYCIMENNQQQILSEIKSLLFSIKTQVVELENKFEEYRQCVETQLFVGDETVDESVKETSVENIVTEHVEKVDEEVSEEVMDIELEPSDDLPFYDNLPVNEVVDFNEDLSVESKDDIAAEHEGTFDATLDATVEDNVEVSVEEVTEIHERVEVQEKGEIQEKVPVIDVMTAKQAWRTDMPGSAVKDVRSAISLHERILFINYLFGEDPMAFQDMLTRLNAMSSFDEAAACAMAEHPEWDLESDTVYRFMMALRRRHQ